MGKMQTKKPNIFKRIVSVCFILILISTMASMVLSYSLHLVNYDNKVIAAFLEAAGEVSANFEKSLIMYTENTQNAINFVDTLRPDTENEFIAFISKLEQLGQELKLDIILSTLESKPKAETLQFAVTFFGSRDSLMRYLEGLEDLPYYIRIDELEFKELKPDEFNQDGVLPNINIILSLYVK